MRSRFGHTLNVLTLLSLAVCIILATTKAILWITYDRYGSPTHLFPRSVRMRAWAKAGLVAILPVVWVIQNAPVMLKRLRESHRAATVVSRCVCAHCNYDLRATPDRCAAPAACSRGRVLFASMTSASTATKIPTNR